MVNGHRPLVQNEYGQGEEYELRPPDGRHYDPEGDAKIVNWRAECFEGRGFGPAMASLLALRKDVDRAHVERLLDEGATVEQVWELVV